MATRVPGQLLTLDQAGVQAISLSHVADGSADTAGNQALATGSFTRTDGSTSEIADINFVTNPTLSVPNTLALVSADVGGLPDLRGSGTVTTLHQAMALDTSGALEGLVQQFVGASTDAQRDSLVSQIIAQWAGVSDISPESRGLFFNGRELAALEKFVGRSYTDPVTGASDPSSEATATVVSASYDSFHDQIYAQLMSQTVLAPLFMQVVPQIDAATGNVFWDFSAVQGIVLSGLALDHTDTLTLLIEFNRTTHELGLDTNRGYNAFRTALTAQGADVAATFPFGTPIIEGTAVNDVIIAWAGNQTVYGNGGQDTLIGGANNETFYSGGSGGTTFIGGPGNETFIGGANSGPSGNSIIGGVGDTFIAAGGGNYYFQSSTENDTYIFNLGGGNVTIFDWGGDDTLKMGAGLTPNNVTIAGTQNGKGLIITDGTVGDKITINDILGGFRIQKERLTLIYGDGTQQVLSDTPTKFFNTTGTPGSDALYGSEGADVFDGKGGSDTEAGFGGSDTFIYNPGYGQLEIDQQAGSIYDVSVLKLGAGITQIGVIADSDGDLFLTDGIAGDQIRIDGGAHRFGGVDQVQFADGSILTKAQLVALYSNKTGTAGADSLSGFDEDNTFDGRGAPAGAQDYERGGGGDDTFVYNPGYGQLEIDQQAGSIYNVNVLKLGAGITPDQVVVTADNNGNFFLTDGIAGDNIRIDGGSNKFSGVDQVQFADGTVWTKAQLITTVSTKTGTTSADSLVGVSIGETFDGKGAPAGSQDYEQGNGGSDTFIYNPGYGQLEINEIDGSIYDVNVLKLGTVITPAQVVVTGDTNGNFFLTDGTAGDQIRIDGGTSQYGGVDQVQFADGTFWTRAQLITMISTKTGTTGADSLVGSGIGETFDGKGAPAGLQDYEQGNGGSDTFLYNPGYGQLEIDQQAGSIYDVNVLKLGAGIIAAQIGVTIDSSGNIVLTDGVAGDTIRIDSSINRFTGVDQVQFADGSSLTKAQLVTLASMKTGTTGTDNLSGSGASETFDGKGAPAGSHDLEYGGGGNDTFIYNPGYGQLEIKVFTGYNEFNTLKLGAGITAAQIGVTSDSDGNLFLTDGIAGDQITIDGGVNRFMGIDQVQFADGSTWTKAQLVAAASMKTGTTGADNLSGSGASETFDGKGAPAGLHDLEYGGGGNDTFIYNPGYGQLEIKVFTGYNEFNTLKLGAGITADQIGLTTDNDGNLFLTDGVVGDQITIDGGINRFMGIDQVQFADSTTWMKAYLIQKTTVPVVTLALANDTGSSSADKITSADDLSGSGDANTTVTIKSGSTVLGSTTSSSTGAWSYTPTGLADGSYVLTASETNTVGNTGTASLAFTFDTTAPAVTMTLASDTGSSSTDKITSSAALTGNGDANATVTIKNGATVIGTTTADGSGRWSYVPTGLADGSYTLTASETDVAGNTGAATLAFSLDTTAPAATMALANDTGSSSTDRITSAAALTGNGDASATVTIKNGTTVIGTTIADSTGAWSYTPTGLADGSYMLTASENDVAGNTGTASLSFTLDATAPAVTMALSSDTGSSGTDSITASPALSGSGDANAMVTVKNGSTVLGTTTASSTGAWSYTPTGLSDGSYTLSASETDTAGNTGTALLAFTLDATAPAVTLALASDTGSSNTDKITSSPALSGTGDANAVVTIKNGSTLLGSTTASSTGAWSYYPDQSGGWQLHADRLGD